MANILKRALKYARKYITNENDYRYHFHTVLMCITIKDFLSDERFLKRMFKDKTGYDLNLDNPQTFNEKLQWLKIHDRKPEYTVMVDKYKVKQYIAEKIGEQYVIPLLGVWDNANDIDFNKLPDKFVLKCNHNSGEGMFICKDKSKLDDKKISSIRKKLNSAVSRNYFWQGREWPYKNVERKIIAEKYMEDAKTGELIDYKFMCFNGEVKCSFVCNDRFSNDGLKVTFYDKEWNIMPFERHYPRSRTPIAKPYCYDEMIKIAEKLSENIPFVRVDFYEINNQIYFGEMTFFPGGGMEEFTPVDWDYTLGSWLRLPYLDK